MDQSSYNVDIVSAMEYTSYAILLSQPSKAKNIGIVFEVCPTSNVGTGPVNSVKDHPLRMMVDGLNVTISTDDPGLFVIFLLFCDCVLAVLDCGMTLADLWPSQLICYEASVIPKAEMGNKLRHAIEVRQVN